MAKVDIDVTRLGRLVVEAAVGFLQSEPYYSYGDTRHVMFESFLSLQGLSVCQLDKDKVEQLAQFYKKALEFHRDGGNYTKIGLYALRWVDKVCEKLNQCFPQLVDPWGYDFEKVLEEAKERHTFGDEHEPFMLYSSPDNDGKKMWLSAAIPETDWPKGAYLVHWNNNISVWVAVRINKGVKA